MRWANAWLVMTVLACQPRASKHPSTPDGSNLPSASPDVSASRSGTEPTPRLDPAKPRERPSPTPVQSREEALHALAHGNPEGARDFLGTHLAAQPEDHEARFALLDALQRLGELEAAQGAAQAAPPSWWSEMAFVRTALLFEDAGDSQQAIATLFVGNSRFPSALLVRGELVRLLHARGIAGEPPAQQLLDELYDAYDRGAARTAEDLLAVAQGALVRGSKGAFKDANMVLEEAEARAPVAAATWTGDRIRLTRARMFAEKYAAQEAMETLELLLARDAWHPDALATAAAVQADELQFAEASRLAKEALAVNPRHARAHVVLAKVALIEGRREEARERVTTHVLRSAEAGASGPAIMAGLALMDSEPESYARWRDEALRFNPHNGPFYTTLADLLGFLHLYPETEEILRDAVEVAPGDAYVRAARGLNLLRLGDETTARQELELAWKRDPFNERTRNVLDLYDQSIAQNYVDLAVADARVRLPRTDAEFIRAVVGPSIASSRAELDAAYGLTTQDLRLEFFESAEDFSIRTVGVPSLGAVAVCFGPVITFIGPYHGTHNIENVIRHELAHVYAIRHSRGRVPRWFTEGLSEWESELADPAWARESARLLQQARKAGKLRRLGDLELAFIRAESAAMMEVAYSTAAYAVRYLGQTYGRPQLIRMLQGYGEGKTTRELVRSVLGREFDQVEHEFDQWFFSQLDARVRGWEPAPPRARADKRDALLARASSQLEAGDLEAARASLEELLRTGGDGFVPRMRLAHVATAAKDTSAARKHLEAARAFRPEAIEPWIALANLARKEGAVDEEKDALRRALAIDGEAFEPAARLLLLAEVSDDPASAAMALRRARAIAPLHPLTLSADALRLHRDKDGEAARTYLDRSLAALPDPPQAPSDTWAVVAIAADVLGRGDEAARVAKVAARLGGLPAPVVRRLGAITGAQ